MKKQAQLIMPAIFMVWASLTAYSQNVGEEFIVDGIKYEITTGPVYLNPNSLFFLPGKVEVVEYVGVEKEVTIPSKVNNQGFDYTVTSIGEEAFLNDKLTGVDIPHTVTRIGDGAFRDNELTEVVIPVARIGASAFHDNPNLNTVIVRSSNPPLLNSNAFNNNPSRGQIRLLVPAGRSQAYEDNGWDGFSSIDPGTFTTTIDGITYAITATAPAKVEIADYDTNSGTEVTIPETVDHGTNTYTVTAIGYRAFHNKQLAKLSFSGESNVTHIREDAFYENQLTGNMEIPESVTSIGQRAFGSNLEMTSVNIPENITRIERWTFAANNLKELTIPVNVEYIGSQAFYGLQNIPIVRCERNPPPEIDKTAFDTPSGPHFRKMDLVVPFIAIQAYEDAGWKEDFGFVSITAGFTTVDKVKYGLVDSPGAATLIADVGVPFHLIIPSEVDIGGNSYPVTAIGDGAFVSTERPLLTVIIPESVKSIGKQAFYVRRIDWMIMMSDDPPALDADAFEYPYRNEIDLIVPEGREQVYKDAGWTGFREVFSLKGRQTLNDGWLWEVTSLIPNEVSLLDYRGPRVDILKIPSEIEYLSNSKLDKTYTVTSIGNKVFKGKKLASVLIPNTVDSIAVSAFHNNELTSIEIPDAVTYIGNYAFAQNQLTSVEIPDNVTYIGESAFQSNQLTSVDIPESVTEIGEHAFSDNKLTSVEIPTSVTHIRESAFAQNQLTKVAISDSVTTIDLYAFLDNPDLRLVTVEAKTPPKLHKDAFSNAYRDQIDLVVPADSLGRRQDYLDNGWHGFRSISFGIFTVDGIKYGITSRTEVMVVDYTGTDTEVTIPETADNGQYIYTVTAIGEGAFQNKELAGVEIPSSVISIGELAFSDNQLTVVTIPSSVERIGSHAFYNNPDLALVTVEAINPPVLDATAFANANRHQIDLVVPTGRMQVYEDNGWGGFRSTLDGSAPPRPTIDAPQSVDHLKPFTVNITFDGDVTDFMVDDIQITNASVSVLTGSGSTYTATIAATSLCDGNITIDVPVNVAMGANSLPNLAAQQVSVGTVASSERCGSEPLVGFNRGISPNGDGIADTLVIEDLEKYKNNVVKVYNLNQQLLFSAHYGGPGNAWDCTHKGSLVPVGSYVCVIDYNEPGLSYEAKMIYVNY